jgi:3-hydroxyacyl-[acyl-carrier-protein] dehydratase
MTVKQTFGQRLSQRTVADGGINASAFVPADSAWYAGHFPGRPILPGIAILALVQEAILATALAEGRNLTITGVNRVRFRLPVNPGDRMEIRVGGERRRDGWAYPFHATLAGEPLCSGIFTAREAEEPRE